MNPLLEKLIADEPALEAAVPQIMAAFELWKDSFAQGGKTLVCGNGGSAADSEHIVGELMKGFLLKRPLPWEEKIGCRRHSVPRAPTSPLTSREPCRPSPGQSNQPAHCLCQRCGRRSDFCPAGVRLRPPRRCTIGHQYFRQLRQRGSCSAGGKAEGNEDHRPHGPGVRPDGRPLRCGH